jgi:hypothetical protein
MSITIPQQKKHLLLLNRLHRTALKSELIPAPSKLLDDKVEKLFNEFFKKKDNYYIPKITSTILKIDEEEFKKLYKEPKQPKQPKQKAMKKEEPTKEMDEEKIKDLISKTKESSYGANALLPHEDILKIYNELNKLEKKETFDSLQSYYKNIQKNFIRDSTKLDYLEKSLKTAENKNNVKDIEDIKDKIKTTKEKFNIVNNLKFNTDKDFKKFDDIRDYYSSRLF